MLKVQDYWDIDNIQHDVSSGAFKIRFISWLKETGLKLSKEEQDAVVVTIVDIKEAENTSSDGNSCDNLQFLLTLNT